METGPAHDRIAKAPAPPPPDQGIIG